jgi:protein phosphatase
MRLNLSDPTLVLLVGPSGAGKSTFALRHFRPTEVVSSDELRARIADDADDQTASADAFRLLALIVGARLARRRTTVVDATNLRANDRRRFVAIARRHAIPVVAIAFDFADDVFLAYNRGRPGRQVLDEVVRRQIGRLRESVGRLGGEGYAQIVVLRTPAEIGALVIERSSPD